MKLSKNITDRLKIIYVIDQPNLYGSEKHVLGLMQHFNFVGNVSLISFSKKGKLLDVLRRESFNVTSFEIGWIPNKDLMLFAKIFKNGNKVVFHGHQPKAIFWGSLLAWVYNRRFISTIHSLPTTNARSANNWLLKILVFSFHLLIKNTAELFSTRVIYLSRFSFKKSLFKYKSSVIPNWIDFIPDESALKHSYDSNCIKLISVGSITYNKGFDRVMLALGTLKNKNWKLTIVGDGSEDYINKLKSICLKGRINENIEFLPFDNQIFDKMGNFDGFVLMSRGETFGLVYIEAMSWGLPIIAWDIPVIKELMPAGNLIINRINEFSSKFRVLFNSQNEYKIQGNKNRSFVLKNFSKNLIMKGYEDLYYKTNKF